MRGIVATMRAAGAKGGQGPRGLAITEGRLIVWQEHEAFDAESLVGSVCIRDDSARPPLLLVRVAIDRDFRTDKFSEPWVSILPVGTLLLPFCTPMLGCIWLVIYGPDMRGRLAAACSVAAVAGALVLENYFPEEPAVGISVMLTLSVSWVLAVVVALRAIRLLRSSHDPSPSCGQGGYNLTGNVSGRCPECGEKI